METQKIFVTGASGFIGANLVRRLLEEGHQVHCLLRETSDLWRIKEVMDQIHIHEGDLTNAGKLKVAMVNTKPDVIFHLGTYGAYPTKQQDIDQMIKVNIMGTWNLIKAADLVGSNRVFVNTSSSSEYGECNDNMDENTSCEPLDYYGATKHATTTLCLTHKGIITFRLFSTYGPYEEPKRLVIDTIKKCLNNEELLFTSGSQIRDFIYVDDVVDAYIATMNDPCSFGDVYNIGRGIDVRVKEMVSQIVNETQCTQPCQFGALPDRPKQSYRWVANVSKAYKVLGWESKTSLEEGVKRTVNWYKENPGLYSIRLFSCK